MAVILVTYDLRKPDRNYQPLYDYLKKFTYCWHVESVWMVDTTMTTAAIRDGIKAHIDQNDIIFVVRLQRDWASWRYDCADWLNDSSRNW